MKSLVFINSLKLGLRRYLKNDNLALRYFIKGEKSISRAAQTEKELLEIF